MRSTCIPSSSPDWLVRATSSLFELGDALAPAHRLWVTTSGPAPEEVGAWISRWGHTCTHSAAETGMVEKGISGPRPSRVSRPDATFPSAHAPAAAPCSSPPVGPPSGAASPGCCRVLLPPVGKEQHQLHSQRPYPDSTPTVTAGAASGPCFVRTKAPGSRGTRPHSCSNSLRGFVCDTWITEGSGDRLVRGDLLAPTPAPHPRPLRPLLGLPVASCTGSRQRQVLEAQGTHSTFLSWEVSSNRLASLVAELPEDKRSDYKADWGRTAEMLGERRNQALRGRSQAEGHPLAAVSDPALGGSASTRHCWPLATRQPLSCSLSSGQCSRQPRQHRPGPTLHAQPVPTGSAGQHLSRQKDGVAGSGDDAPSSATSPRRGLSPQGSWGWMQAGSGTPGLHVPRCDFFNKCMDKDLKLFITELFWQSLKQEWDFSRSLSY